MKKLSLIALLSILTIGVASCGNPSSSEPAPAPSTSETPVSSETVSENTSSEEPTSSEVSSESSEKEETNALPAAWSEENPDFKANKCSVTLVPAEGSTQKSVKEFLNVPGIRFIDLRDESEGYSIGHVERFESISYFNYVEKLFTPDADKKVFTPVYADSADYVELLFPRNTPIFLMCQGGGRVVYMMNLLKQLEYDMSMIYNVGGWSAITAAEKAGNNPYQVTTGFGAKAKVEYNIDLEPVATAKAAKRNAESTSSLPNAWAEENPDFKANKCSVTLVPAEGSTQKSVKEFFDDENVRFIDLRDSSEGYAVGHVERFESISYFNYVEKLYTPDADKKVFTANFEESQDYIELLFPRDTPIFLMCQGGGRVVYMMNLLKQLEYDMSMIYNVGGWSAITAAEKAGTNPYQVTTGFGAKAKVEYNINLEPVKAAE